MFAISVTEIVISVNSSFILGCIRQCFSAPASSSCLVLPQITAGRKGTPGTAPAPQPWGWAHQREEQLLCCSAVFWGSHLMAPVSSSLLAPCQLSAGAHTKHSSLCLKPFLSAEILQGWWDEPSHELCVCANLPLSVYVPFVFPIFTE